MIKKMALIVGINDYGEESGFEPLKYAESDAQLMSNTLINVSEFKVETLLGQDASLDKITKRLRSFYKEKDLDLFLFYFAGHGEFLQEVGMHCLHCFGSESGDTICALNLYDWARRIQNNIQSKQSVLVIDACRNKVYRGMQSRGVSGLNQAVYTEMKELADSTRDIIVKAKNDESREPSLLYTFLSTGVGKVSYEDSDLEHGIFTYALAETIKKEGHRLPLSQLRKEVGRWTLDWCKTKKWFPEQIPEWIEPSLPGDVYLVKPVSGKKQEMKKPVRIDMTEVVGILSIKCDTDNADLYIDGESIQKLKRGYRIRLHLIEGEHQVKVVKGEKKIEGTVSIEENQENKLDIKLKPETVETIEPAVITQPKKSAVKLRSSYQTLSDADVKAMLKKHHFFDIIENKNGNFKHDYEAKTIKDDKVVIDHKTGLMWQQEGSQRSMRVRNVDKWIKDLNRKSYAGYHDWRLPTLNEGASLLENKKQNGLYIDPVFSDKQRHIWTGDRSGLSDVWKVDFHVGFVSWRYQYARYVRAVRTLEEDKIVKLGTKLQKEQGIVEIAEPPAAKSENKPLIQLRSTYKTLSDSEVKSMLMKYNFFDKNNNKGGHFDNDYESKTIKGDDVVIDHVTGLMWQQGGSDDHMNFYEANEWISKLNQRGYAGYNNWRLPTLEEGVSLLENTEKNESLYIDPLFSKRQRRIWTGDEFSGDEFSVFPSAWVVRFIDGSVYSFVFGFARAVRSGQ